MLGRGRAGPAGLRRVRHGGRVAERPHAILALHAHVVVDDDPPALVERQAEVACCSGCGTTPAVQTSVRVGIVSPVEIRAQLAVTSSSVVPSRMSMPRPRSSRSAYSASSLSISGSTRSVASTSTQRMPCRRARG